MMMMSHEKKTPVSMPPLDIWVSLLEDTELGAREKQVARARIALLATSLRRRVSRLLWVYRAGKVTVTVGALLIPALTGLDSQRVLSNVTFWLIWSLSIATGTSNAFISLFGIDRKYFMLKEQLIRLEAEAWLFIALAGKYKTGGGHKFHFTSFMERCESILDKAARLQDSHTRKEDNIAPKTAKKTTAFHPPPPQNERSDDEGDQA